MKNILRIFAIFAVLFPCLIHAADDDQRLLLIRALQDLRTGKSISGFDMKTGEIAAAIEAGDEGLAYHAIRAGDKMLDNEAYSAVLAAALMKFPDRVIATFEYMPEDTRNLILKVAQDLDPLLFEDKAEGAKFNAVVKDLVARNAKIEDKIRLTDGRPAFIDDPDGYTNLRLEPSTKAPIIDQIKSGEEFLVIREEGDWCLVNSPRGDIAYLHKSRVHYKYAK